MACANVANLMLARGAARAREMAVRVVARRQPRATRPPVAHRKPAARRARRRARPGSRLAAHPPRSAPDPARTPCPPASCSRWMRASSPSPRSPLWAAAFSSAWPPPGRLHAALWLPACAPPAAQPPPATPACSASSRWREIAIAVIVVTGAGLFLRTLDRLSQVDPGYHAEHVLTASVILPLTTLSQPPRTRSPSTRPRSANSKAFPACAPPPSAAACRSTGFDIGQGFRPRRERTLRRHSLPDRRRALLRNPRHPPPVRPHVSRIATTPPRPRSPSSTSEFVRRYFDGRVADRRSRPRSRHGHERSANSSIAKSSASPGRSKSIAPASPQTRSRSTSPSRRIPGSPPASPFARPAIRSR